MAFIERREVDTKNGASLQRAPIDQDRPEIIEDFPPARIHVFCDFIDTGGQVFFRGSVSHLIVAIRRRNSEEPELVPNFENGVSFEEDETLFIGSEKTTSAIALDYNPTYQNRVLRQLYRSNEK